MAWAKSPSTPEEIYQTILPSIDHDRFNPPSGKRRQTESPNRFCCSTKCPQLVAVTILAILFSTMACPVVADVTNPVCNQAQASVAVSSSTMVASMADASSICNGLSFLARLPRGTCADVDVTLPLDADVTPDDMPRPCQCSAKWRPSIGPRLP